MRYQGNLLVIEDADIQALRSLQIVQAEGEQQCVITVTLSKRYTADSDQPLALYLTDDGEHPRLVEVTPAAEPPAPAPEPPPPHQPTVPAPVAPPAAPPPAPKPAAPPPSAAPTSPPEPLAPASQEKASS